MVEPVTESLPAVANAVSVGLLTEASYALARSVAKDLAASDLVPQHYRGKPANCIIALNMANRIGADPLMVMQNLYMVHGNPAWSAQFLIACFNQCGRFSSLRYEFKGAEGADDWGCRAYAVEKSTGETLHGTWITIAIAKAEGWHGKQGSKWKTMPQQMLMYRAASWFVRAYAPEIAMGLQTKEELRDTYDLERDDDGSFGFVPADPAADLNATLGKQGQEQPEAPEKGKGHRPTKAEKDQRRAEALTAWEGKGGTQEEAEKLVNAFLANWSTAQCDKIKAAAEQKGTMPPPVGGDMISCPMEQGAKVAVSYCVKCLESGSCAEFKEYEAEQAA